MSMATSARYYPHNEASLPPYLNNIPGIANLLGGKPADWRIQEVGDGNLNLVFIVRGPSNGIVVKQALPYVRLVGESWPLPLSRAHFEQRALREQAQHAPGLVPEIYHYDEALALIAMELLEPHIIMRKGMIQGIEYPQFAEHITDFMARSLFFSSDLALSAAEKKARMAVFCGNTALCKITEDLVFTEPYMLAENNRWTSPQLDADAQAIRTDSALKVGVSELKLKFLTSAQALIHGDLHTGSIMLTQTDTRVIDPEFAFYGPIGFDPGACIANLLLNYFSQDGHATAQDPRTDYQEWILQQVEAVWTGFDAKFRALWREQHQGDAYPQALFVDDAQAQALAQDRYMQNVFADVLGFAGAKMIRRILGLAHNIDLEWIEDPEQRAQCERRGLRAGRELILNQAAIGSIAAVSALARDLRAELA